MLQDSMKELNSSQLLKPRWGCSPFNPPLLQFNLKDNVKRLSDLQEHAEVLHPQRVHQALQQMKVIHVDQTQCRLFVIWYLKEVGENKEGLSSDLKFETE